MYLSSMVSLDFVRIRYLVMDRLLASRLERENYHTFNQKVDLGPDLQPGGSRPGELAGNDGDVQCVRARPLVPGGASGRIDIVAQTRHSCKQYAQARYTGKQSVYTVQLSASPSYIRYTPLETE